MAFQSQRLDDLDKQINKLNNNIGSTHKNINIVTAFYFGTPVAIYALLYILKPKLVKSKKSKKKKTLKLDYYKLFWYTIVFSVLIYLAVYAYSIRDKIIHTYKLICIS